MYGTKKLKIFFIHLLWYLVIVQEAPAVNIAIKNSGIDMSFVHRGSLSGGELGYEVTLNVATLKNEIVALAPGITYFSGGSYRGNTYVRNAVGQPLSSFYLYKTDGYFDNQAEIDACNSKWCRYR